MIDVMLREDKTGVTDVTCVFLHSNLWVICQALEQEHIVHYYPKMS